MHFLIEVLYKDQCMSYKVDQTWERSYKPSDDTDSPEDLAPSVITPDSPGTSEDIVLGVAGGQS